MNKILFIFSILMLNSVGFVLSMKPRDIPTIYEDSGEIDQGESDNTVQAQTDQISENSIMSGQEHESDRFSISISSIERSKDLDEISEQHKDFLNHYETIQDDFPFDDPQRSSYGTAQQYRVTQEGRHPGIGRARSHQRFSGDQQSLESNSFNNQTPRRSRGSRHRQEFQAETTRNNYRHDHSQHEYDHRGEYKCRCTTM